MAGPRIEHYRWPGGREAMLRFGPEGGPLVVALPALLEEANRTRAFLIAVLRALADRGVGSVLPDLPGTGESERDTADASLADWQAALAALAEAIPGPLASVSIRAGCLVDTDHVIARWQLAPVSGTEFVRELERMRVAEADGDLVEIAGNRLSRGRLLDPLAALAPPPARVVRLVDDPRPADARVDGPPLWRRSEPAVDPGLVQAVTADIAGWWATCAG